METTYSFRYIKKNLNEIINKNASVSCDEEIIWSLEIPYNEKKAREDAKHYGFKWNGVQKRWEARKTFIPWQMVRFLKEVKSDEEVQAEKQAIVLEKERIANDINTKVRELTKKVYNLIYEIDTTYSREELKDEFNKIYEKDKKFETMDKNSVIRMYEMNWRLRAINPIQFGPGLDEGLK